MLKICFLSSMHTPTDKRVFDKEARTLAAAGFAVTHLAPGEIELPSTDGVNLVVYPPPRGLAGRLGQVFSLYKRGAAIDADCYHCNEVDSWIVGLFLKLLRGKKVVFDVHEHYPSAFGRARLPRWLHPLSSALIRLLFQVLTLATDRVVLAKRSVARDFPQKSKHVLVQNFAPLAALQQKQLTAPAQRSETPTAIHLGLFSKARGWPQLLDALEQIPDASLKVLLVGTFNDNTFSEFQQRLRDASLEDRVQVEEWLPFDEAFARVCSANIGLVLFQPGIQNHVYAMPHKMFDYMLAGLPVIAPAFAEEVSEIVRETNCGILVDPSNPTEISQALERLVNDTSLCRRLGENGRQAVGSKYNWEAEAAKLIDMYVELAGTLERPAIPRDKGTSIHKAA